MRSREHREGNYTFKIIYTSRRAVPPRRSNAIFAAAIGHLKNEHRIGRNYLHHRSGDAPKAIPAATGYNFSLLLRWLRLLLRLPPYSSRRRLNSRSSRSTRKSMPQ
jgi:IS5 family transposase